MIITALMALVFGVVLAGTEFGRGILMVLMIALGWVVYWAYFLPHPHH